LFWGAGGFAGTGILLHLATRSTFVPCLHRHG
jgi:hypothetical protein